jgi:hypothetical protein
VLDDGEGIEGTFRPAFITNGDTYYLTDLKIYADGRSELALRPLGP